MIAAELRPVLEDLDLGEADVEVLELSAVDPGQRGPIAAAVLRRTALVVLPAAPDDARLAALRDALWPDAHVAAIYRLDPDGSVRRRTLAGGEVLAQRLPGPWRTVLWVRSREDALGRSTTRAKFDANATGWNGEPGSATYGHFRWMRKLLADVAAPAPGERALDAGCGAGWVGIEAALQGAMVSAFDPSPAMVELARDNARRSGVDLDARVGFVEDVPFERPFDVVLSSGVLSFAPDADVFLERLDALVTPGGRLVIGDLNPLSRGFARRRRRPLLPARELNGWSRQQVEGRLAARGYVVEQRWSYQLSFPLPELMTLSEQRLAGRGCGLALVLNKLAAGLDHRLGARSVRCFDSWILRARRPAS